MQLFRFQPLAGRCVATPVPLVHSPVGGHTMADLQEDRSMARKLLAQGLDVYLVDWGQPVPVDRCPTTDDCISGYLAHIQAAHGVDVVNLLGVGQGIADYTERAPPGGHIGI